MTKYSKTKQVDVSMRPITVQNYPSVHKEDLNLKFVENQLPVVNFYNSTKLQFMCLMKRNLINAISVTKGFQI